MTVTEAPQRGQTTTRASRGRTTTATPRPATAPAPAPAEKKQFDLNLPFVKIQIRPPDLHLPHVGLPHVGLPRVNRRDMGHAVDIARTFLPPPERIAYYGGLGALAAIGLIEWPVAAAIGAGTMIAQRARARQDRWSPLRAAQQQPQPATARATSRTAGRATAEGAPKTTPRAAARATAQKSETTKAGAKAPSRGATSRARAGAK